MTRSRPEFPRCPECGKPPREYKEYRIVGVIVKADAAGIPCEVARSLRGNAELLEAVCVHGHRWDVPGVRSAAKLRRALSARVNGVSR